MSVEAEVSVSLGQSLISGSKAGQISDTCRPERLYERMCAADDREFGRWDNPSELMP